MQERDVVRHMQLVAGLVPPGTVDGQHGLRIGGEVGADLLAG